MIYYQDAKSFNGKTTDFESVNGGSIPSLANAEWSNGRTLASEASCEGSNPSSAANRCRQMVMELKIWENLL